jgi:hypothetical protein
MNAADFIPFVVIVLIIVLALVFAIGVPVTIYRDAKAAKRRIAAHDARLAARLTAEKNVDHAAALRMVAHQK